MEGETLDQVNEAQNGVEVAREVNNPHESNIQGEKIVVERGRLNSLMIYDVTESELVLLEKTSDASVWLNFFIGTLTAGLSFLISLLTVEWKDNMLIQKIVFICIVVIMGITSLICFVFWYRGKGERNKTIITIRNRRKVD